MINKNLTIIGVGKMGQAIAERLLETGTIAPQNLTLSGPRVARLSEYRHIGVRVLADNKEAIKGADIIILAVKPQKAKEVLFQISNTLNTKSLIISIMAGINVKNIGACFNNRMLIVRVMPNINAMEGESMSLWFCNGSISKDNRSAVKKIIGSIGSELELNNEMLIDKLTVISGSGPAFVFYLVEQMEKFVKNSGIKTKQSKTIIKQLFLGSIRTIINSALSAEELRKEVTTKGGVTEKAFQELEKAGTSKVFQRAFNAGAKKVQRLNL